jgi:hypothetical protein
MMPLNTIGKALLRLSADEFALAELSRSAAKHISSTHFATMHTAVSDSLTLCEQGMDSTTVLLGTRDMRASTLPVEVAVAAAPLLPSSFGNPSSVKVQLRAAHEALAQSWLAIKPLMTGAEALSAQAFSTSHAALAVQFGAGNGSPGIT